MKDIILIEKNVHIRCEIELLLLKFNMNILHIKKQNHLQLSFFIDQTVIINALDLPKYENMLKYSLVIIYGIKPIHNTYNNFIYLSYDTLLINLNKVLKHLNNPKLHLATTSLYNETLAQYLLKKLNGNYNDKTPLEELKSKKFTLNIINKTIDQLQNFLNMLIEMQWMNENIKTSILNILNSMIIIKKKMIINIDIMTLTNLHNTYYISIKDINNTSFLYTINDQQKQLQMQK